MDIYSQAIERYGKETQILKAFEEIGELMQAISKHHLGKANDLDVLEEIVDVKILMQQLFIIFNNSGINQSVLHDKKIAKLKAHLQNNTK